MCSFELQYEIRNESDIGGDEMDLIDFQIRLKCEPEYFPEGSDWSTQAYFNCYLCSLETDGFRYVLPSISLHLINNRRMFNVEIDDLVVKPYIPHKILLQ